MISLLLTLPDYLETYIPFPPLNSLDSLDCFLKKERNCWNIGFKAIVIKPERRIFGGIVFPRVSTLFDYSDL